MISLAQAQIKKANPLFGSIYDSREKFVDYVHNRITKHEFLHTHLKRQAPYRQFIKAQVDRLFKTEDVKVNFEENMILDTTAHHNILNYPAIIGAHMVTRFDTILNRKEMGDYYVLDCGNVSFSEVLHKRGVEFGGRHINLYPKKDKNMLVSRYPLYKLDNGRVHFLNARQSKKLTAALKKDQAVDKPLASINGIAGSPGKVIGKIRCLKSARECGKIKAGEILLVSNTTPDFMPAIRLARAIITNEGGITCHAAIVSRELKIPCVVGTKIATQVFKDGDRVEVDANKGIVKKI